MLQKKINSTTYFSFESMLADGYTIQENPKELKTLQFTNNKRIKFVTTQDDIIINTILSPKTTAQMREYITNLTSGTYKYYSIKYGMWKEADFIVDIEPFVMESFINDNLILQDFQVTLKLGVEINEYSN